MTHAARRRSRHLRAIGPVVPMPPPMGWGIGRRRQVGFDAVVIFKKKRKVEKRKTGRTDRQTRGKSRQRPCDSLAAIGAGNLAQEPAERDRRAPAASAADRAHDCAAARPSASVEVQGEPSKQTANSHSSGIIEADGLKASKMYNHLAGIVADFRTAKRTVHHRSPGRTIEADSRTPSPTSGHGEASGHHRRRRQTLHHPAAAPTWRKVKQTVRPSVSPCHHRSPWRTPTANAASSGGIS